MSMKWFFLVAIILGGVSFWTATSILQAHYLGAGWGSSSVYYNDITNNYSSEAASRRSNFNAAVNDVSIVCCGSQVQIGDASYGWIGWLGLCSWSTQYPFWSTMYVDMNETYLDYYNDYYLTSAIFAHEYGHCFGALDHHNSGGRIMQSSFADFYQTDGVWYMDGLSAAEIDWLY